MQKSVSSILFNISAVGSQALCKIHSGGDSFMPLNEESQSNEDKNEKESYEDDSLFLEPIENYLCLIN